jgi:hypothetical protein
LHHISSVTWNILASWEPVFEAKTDLRGIAIPFYDGKWYFYMYEERAHPN